MEIRINHRSSQHPLTPTLTSCKLHIFTPASDEGSSDFELYTSNKASKKMVFVMVWLAEGEKSSGSLQRQAGILVAVQVYPPLLSVVVMGGGCSPPAQPAFAIT